MSQKQRQSARASMRGLTDMRASKLPSRDDNRVSQRIAAIDEMMQEREITGFSQLGTISAASSARFDRLSARIEEAHQHHPKRRHSHSGRRHSQSSHTTETTDDESDEYEKTPSEIEEEYEMALKMAFMGAEAKAKLRAELDAQHQVRSASRGNKVRQKVKSDSIFDIKILDSDVTVREACKGASPCVEANCIPALEKVPTAFSNCMPDMDGDAPDGDSKNVSPAPSAPGSPRRQVSPGKNGDAPAAGCTVQ
mmetsp:Transcript_54373/g.89992  ORF Transcript_54373/g.89992 Transcript_54373/m.89992 type:complete len:252 (+) Transcript_54373:114-869(+)